MELRLHANATTTPRTRAYIQSSTVSVAELAGELGVSEDTIRRWRSRSSVSDRSHTPHKLAISLSDLEERLVTELRSALGLPLDDIVAVMRRCVNPKLSRSAIHRCLARHGISARPKAACRRLRARKRWLHPCRSQSARRHASNTSPVLAADQVSCSSPSTAPPVS
jgi:transposase-like protein